MLHARGVCRLLALVSFLGFYTGATVRAQSNNPPPGPTQSLSANPFTMMFGWFNADYERRMTSSTTWGASGSSLSFDGFRYKNANVTFKYYPRAAMDGFYIGGRSGVYRVGANDSAATFYGAGFELGYNWLLGRRDTLVVGLGAGVTRLFGGELDGASLAVPTVRLVNVGLTF